MIRLNDFQTQWLTLGKEILAAVQRVGTSGWYILGKEVSRFEIHLASATGATYAVGCANGLDAIEIALRVCGLRPGDRVITTPLSAFATTLAIIRAGGVPVFIDVDQSGLLDLELTQEWLAQREDKPSFLLPVHLYGHCINLKTLSELKSSYNLRVIEDCAQAIGSRSAAARCGSVGQVAATSFYPTKNLWCMGDGGAILTNGETLAASAKQLRDYGQEKKYLHASIGLNSRLDELQAAIMADAVLPRLAGLTERRRAIAATFLNSISNSLVTIPPAPADSHSVYHLFPVLIAENREGFMTHLRERGVESGVHYPFVIPDQPAMKLHPFVIDGALPEARRFSRAEVSLPIHPYLSDSDVHQVVEACNSWTNSR
jgi:dTDP-3-amino-3,4,6-trideoxy-alpha-D-glucose transaminase